ncbi:DUF1493 family protein [Caballeronia sp. LZ019]|nr:DUF1493 family protein [Caballeronia sp. LZ019]MDR5808815.1 DUF1493 family protein [Caballeronia sp. LZ019]
MTQPSEVSAELENFIRAQMGIPSTRVVSPSDSLERDLGLTGDDAAYFMEAYFERFSIRLGDFDFTRYFMEESSPGPFLLLASLMSKRVRRHYQREPLTVAMLQRAIDIGAWDSVRVRN